MSVELYLYRYRINCEVKSPIYFPTYKGSTLRGIFGHTLKEVICISKRKVCEECPLKESCIYTYIFETPTLEAKYKNAPHPYIIVPPLTEKRLFFEGEKFFFEISLIGKANDYLPYIIYALLKMQDIGVGIRKGKFKIKEIQALFLKEEPKIVYDPEKDKLEKVDNKISFSDFLNETYNKNELKLIFQTPLRLKNKGKLIIRELPFLVFMERLLERIYLLSYYHCNFKTFDYKEILEKSEEVKIIESNFSWYDWERFSKRKGRMKLGGVIGSIRYRGNFNEFFPYIKMGEYIHIGKATVFGLGKYKIF